MKKFILSILTTLFLGFGFIFAQNILPDSADISVKDPIIMGEATNLKVTILKNGSKMTSYNGTIRIIVTDEDGKKLKDNEYTVPSQGMYAFLGSDLGTKEFQRGLEIKKEGTFYIEIQDLNENEDKVLGKQLVHVIKKNGPDEVKYIEVLNPIPNANLIGDKIEIIGTATDIPNSEAIIYIDEKEAGTTKVDSNGIINYTIGNVAAGQHTLLLEIPDLAGNVMGRSDKIFFTISPAGDSGIKNVLIEPEKGLMIGDMTSITVYTDDMIESVKMKLSDRPENDSMVMNKVGVGEFNQNVRLIGSGEISLSFETASSNNSVIQKYDDYKKFSVGDLPYIQNIKINTDVINRSADISREVLNSSVVSSYLIDRWVEGSNTLSGKDRSDKTSFRFSDVPYDTIVNLNITPYRSNESKHGAASKTIQFVITKNQADGCGNGICEDGESHELCPQDCDGEGGTTIIPWRSCSQDHVSVRTTKIGDSYYLVRDKIENVKKYLIYSSSTPDGKDKTKVYETTDTSYEYPFDHNSKEDVYMYFWIYGICEDGEELELTGATKVQVGPAENFFLLMCLTLLIYSGIKLFRQTE